MIDLKQYGYKENEIPADGLMPGRITEVQREQYTVMTELGEVTAELKGSFYYNAEVREDYPCVGDFVFLQYNESGVTLITKLLPRRSKFSRADLSGHKAEYVKTVLEQVLAANFDFCFIVTSLNQDFKVNRILRYLTQVQNSGGKPVIILTKADLAKDIDGVVAEVRKAAPDVPVHAVSSLTGHGMDALAEYLIPGNTVVFLGMSGVGKSSLVNKLMKQEVMAVKAIREDDSRGRHTTTHRQLFMLPSGAMVIDTPGMRELGLFDAEKGISASFSDVEELFTGCRFSDCQHRTEPGCAVRSALENGSLPQERWERYLSQRKENQFVEDKSGYLTDKEEWAKSISKWSKAMKKGGGFKR